MPRATLVLIGIFCFWRVVAIVRFALTHGTLRLLHGNAIAKMRAGDGGQGTTAYREVTRASEIAEELTTAGLLGATGGSSIASSLDERMLEAAGFEVFASFRTNRTKYR